MSSNDYDIILKIVLNGRSGVGNYSLVKRLVHGRFSFDTQAIIGVEYLTQKFLFNDERIKAQIFITAGQERFKSIIKSYFKGADGFILSYDISDKFSFLQIPERLKEIREFFNGEYNPPIMLVGTKSDRPREVTTEEGSNIALREGLMFAETSSLENINVEESFVNLIIEIYNRRKSTNFSHVTYSRPNKMEYQSSFEKDDKYFLYKNEIYPFNFVSFKYQSIYFSENCQRIQNENFINIISEFDSISSISPESIRLFIWYCKFYSIEINTLNVQELYILSKKHGISGLAIKINEFVYSKFDEIIDDLFTNDKMNKIEISYFYEDLISSHLKYAISIYEEKILSFPFYRIYRILQKYSSLKNDKKTDECDSQINKFLLKIIKINGIDTFRLLIELGIIDNNPDAINELLDSYLKEYEIDPLIMFIISSTKQEINQLQTKISLLEIEMSAQKRINYSKMKKISIPNEITHILPHSFSKLMQLQEVILPRTLEIIDDHSFSGCISLKQITIPSSVKKICSYSFSGCKSLMKVNILSSSIKIISLHLFEGCESLKTITLPSSISEIEDYAFADCSLLNNITIPLSVKKIGSYSFSGCTSLEEFDISNTVMSISPHMFDGCKSLKTIKIPSSVVIIDDFAFAKCSHLDTITIPSSVRIIGNYSFSNCISLKSILFPKKKNYSSYTSTKRDDDILVIESSFSYYEENYSKLIKIGNCAFDCCSSLIDIEIPPSTNELGTNAFKNCSCIKEIKIPSRLCTNSIGLNSQTKIIKI